jgi:sec-independent protein translocase protein TatA
MPELLVIMAIAMLIFGAGKLPEIAGGLGKAIRDFKKSVHEPEPDRTTPVPDGAAKEQKAL